MKVSGPVLAGLVLAGCVSVFPKVAPEQLYRFGEAGPAAQQTPSSTRARIDVQAQPIEFDRAAAGDLILTVSGDEAAYVKGARWITSASTLFEQAMEQAFAADQGPARLMSPGEAVRPDYSLKVGVRRFEASYANGRAAPPVVIVELYAALSRTSDRSLAGERTFTVSIPVADNRMGPIAKAFDDAVGQALGQLVGWVDTTAVGYAGSKPA